MTSEGQYAGTQPAEATSGGPTSDGLPPDADGRRASGRATAQPPADGFPSSYAPPPPATPNGGSPFVVPAVSSFGQGSESAGSRPAGTSYGSARVPQPEESDHGVPASPYGSVSPFAPPGAGPAPSYPPPSNGSAPSFPPPSNGSGSAYPPSANASDSGLPRRSPAAAPGDPLPQRNPTTPPELTEFDGFAAGNPARGLAGNPPPAPSRVEIGPATGRPPGISAFGDQRVRVPGASLSDLPDAPAPGRGGFPAAPEESGPSSGGFPLRGGGGAFPTRRGDSGGFPLRSSAGSEGDAPGGDLPIRGQQSPFAPPASFGSPVDDAPHPYARASAPEQPSADAPYGRGQFGEPPAGPFARPGDQSADGGASFGTARPTTFGSAAVGSSGGNSPFGADQSDPPFGAGRSETPFGNDQSNSPFGGDQSSSPFGNDQSSSPFGNDQSNSPFGNDQSNSPFRAGQSDSPFASAGGAPPVGRGQAGGDQFGGDPRFGGESPSSGAQPGSGTPYGSTPPVADPPFGGGGDRPGREPRFGDARAGSDLPYGPSSGRPESEPPAGQPGADSPFGNARPSSGSAYGSARRGSTYGSAAQPEIAQPEIAQPEIAQPEIAQLGSAQSGGNSPYDGAQPGSALPYGAPDNGSPFRSPGSNSPYGGPENPPAFGSPDNAPAFGSPDNGPAFGSSDNGPVFGGPDDAAAFGSSDNGPAFGSPDNAPAFGSPDNGSAFGSAGNGPAYPGAEDGSRFGAPDSGPRFGSPEQSDDALYRRPASPAGDSASFGSAYPRRVPGAALGAVGLPNSADGSPISLPGSPYALPGSPSALPGSPPALPGSPGAGPFSAGPFGAASAGEPRNGPVPQPRDPAERSAPAIGSARPVTASAAVPSASRVAPVDPSELPPPPAVPQARVYGRPAAEPTPAADEAPTPEPEQPSNADFPFRPPTPYGPPPFGDRPDDRRTPGAFGSPAFPAPLSLPGSPPAFGGAPGPGNDANGPSGVSGPPYPGQPGSDQNGFGSPAYPGRPADGDPARASARASASARVAPPGPQPTSPDRPGNPPFGEPTSDVAGRGRAPEQYTELTTDIAGREEPYVPAPALPTFPPAGQPLGDRPPMGGLFPGPANRATVTPPTPEETTSWPGVEASDQSRFDQFQPDADAAPTPVKAETPHVRMLPILLAVVVGAALLVGLAFGIVYLVAGGDSGSSNAGFTVNTGDCVKKSGTAAVKADCNEASSFQVVSIVDDKSKCADPQQPYVLNPTSDGKTQVLCLKPNS